ncbi:hypothetical protein QWJ46_06955 [Rhizobium sp. CBN3]|uniref:hypothetical protein n=1 Tax=Rhizobium sp. CBN3 TaxID=3058045 RepID=UPI002671E26F|nr:hypothetical protein [Rhizobium sp. CBN3]MDO3432420.1 hypothetical protein [Rhizobium sp. CBN3]
MLKIIAKIEGCCQESLEIAPISARSAPNSRNSAGSRVILDMQTAIAHTKPRFEAPAARG